MHNFSKSGMGLIGFNDEIGGVAKLWVLRNMGLFFVIF
jgi:hypothetical protein